MGQPQLHLIKGGIDDSPGDSPDITPDYRDFLPQGKTRFGVLDEENEAAFRAQFPELIPALNQLKKEIQKWQEIFQALPSTAAKEQAKLLDWKILIESTTDQEAPSPSENLFRVAVQCVDSPASGFKLLQEVYDWTQRIPGILQSIQQEKEEAGQRYQKAAEAINGQLMQWTWGEDENRPSLELKNLEESVKALRGLQFSRKKTFLRGGAGKFGENIDFLDREGRHLNEALNKERSLSRIQTILAERLPSISNLQTWGVTFREYQSGPTPIKASPNDSFSFTHDPVLGAVQKARAAQEEERARARQEAEHHAAEEARKKRDIAAVRATTRRRLFTILASFLAAVALAAAYAIWETIKTKAIEEEIRTMDGESRALREEAEQFRAIAANDEMEIETLIGKIVEDSVEEALKNPDALANYAEFGDMTFLYRTIVAAFNERLTGDEWIRMTEMVIDVIPEEEGVGPPYFYTFEIKYSVQEMDSGVTHERALLRQHVPFDRVPTNPMR